MAKAAATVCISTGGNSWFPIRAVPRSASPAWCWRLTCLAWFPFTGGRISSSLVFLIAYAIFAVGTLFETRFDSAPRALVALVIDFAFFAFSKWLLPVDWASALAYGFLLVSAATLHEFITVLIVAAAAMVLIVLLTAPGGGLIWADWAAAVMAVAFSLYKRYLERRMSNTLRYNMIIRSQAEGAREAERERIAADFHDGPLQSFISFQMRLEIVRKLLGARYRRRRRRTAPVAGAVPRPGDGVAQLRAQHAAGGRRRSP